MGWSHLVGRGGQGLRWGGVLPALARFLLGGEWGAVLLTHDHRHISDVALTDRNEGLPTQILNPIHRLAHPQERGQHGVAVGPDGLCSGAGEQRVAGTQAPI